MKNSLMTTLILLYFVNLNSQSSYYKYDSKNRLILDQTSDCSYTKYNLDANGNRVSVQIGQIVVNPKIDTITCYKSDNAKIDLRPDSAGRYTYLWSNAKTSPTIENLASGSYTVTITDKNTGAECYKSFSLKEPDSIKLKLIITNNICYLGKTGKAVIDTAFLGSGFQYKWSDGSTNSYRYTLAKGNYSVIVTEYATGCKDTISATITEPDRVSSAAENIVESCKDKPTGKFSVTTTGGISPYQYAINTGNFSANTLYENLSATSHKLYTRDANSCYDTLTVPIPGKNCNSSISNQSQNNLITLYPNPNQGFFNLEFSETLSGQVEIQITAIDGKLVKDFSLVNIKSNKTHSFTTEALATGDYILIIKKGNRVIDSIKLKKD